MRPGDPAATVLFVCTGNICRSPVAERLFAAGLHARLGTAAGQVACVSAGTWGLTGSTMEPFAAAALRELGGSDEGFRARELSAELVCGADLVLCATREHRAEVVTLVPAAVRRAFTVVEFARLCTVLAEQDLPGGPPAERLAALVAAAGRARGLVRADRPEQDDLPDPIGAAAPVFRRSAEQIAAALRGPLDLLAGPGPGDPAGPDGGGPA